MIGAEGAHEQLVKRLWQAFNDLQWEEAAGLLHPDFIADWPQSGEKFRGPANFISMNKHYPGTHKLEVQRITSIGNTVISVVQITSNETQTLFAISFFEISEGRIVKAIEYFADASDAPEWRAQWVECV